MSYESLLEKLKNSNGNSNFLDDIPGSVCVKFVLWLLRDPTNSEWTVDNLLNYLDPSANKVESLSCGKTSTSTPYIGIHYNAATPDSPLVEANRGVVDMIEVSPGHATSFITALTEKLKQPELTEKNDSWQCIDANPNEVEDEYPIGCNPLERVRVLSYLLSEKEGFPHGQEDRFWQEALYQLTPRNWNVKSGELSISGYGELDDIISLAYSKATSESLTLDELTYVTSDEVGKENSFHTETKLKQLGLWN